MIEVCKETRRSYTWFFNPINKEFISLDISGNLVSTIKGSHIPDPDKIAANRRELKEKGLLPLDAREKADIVTIKLWNFYNAYINTKL